MKTTRRFKASAGAALVPLLTVASILNAPLPASAQTGIAQGGHGYLRRPDGRFTPIDVPNAQYTGVNAATDNGDLAGYYVPQGSPDGHGFIARDGRITTFDAPDADGTTAFDINDHDQIVGTGFPHIEARRLPNRPGTPKAIP